MTQTSGKSPHRRRCRRGAPRAWGGEGECLIPLLKSDSLRRPRVLHPVVITGTDGGAGTGSAQPADANRCQLHFPRHVVLFLSLAVFPLDPRHSLLDLKVFISSIEPSNTIYYPFLLPRRPRESLLGKGLGLGLLFIQIIICQKGLRQAKR